MASTSRGQSTDEPDQKRMKTISPVSSLQVELSIQIKFEWTSQSGSIYMSFIWSKSFWTFLDHLSHSGDLLLWVVNVRRATSVMR